MNQTDNAGGGVINGIKKAVADFNFPLTGKKIVVGLSGGADSVSLTHCLKINFGCEVIACHINHNLRGEESLRDENFVTEFCKKHGIRIFKKSIEVKDYAASNSISIEEAGREIRYGYFEEIRLIENADFIATAHTLSDNAETLLFNLTRGTGLNGLCGIPPVRGDIVRPLIYSTRAEVEEYCNERHLDFVNDSTNAENIYSRNSIRNKVIPVLKEINPAFESGILRSVKAFQADNAYLDKQAEKLLFECRTDEKSSYLLSFLQDKDEAIRNRTIGKILEENNLSKSAELIMKINGIITASKGKINIAKSTFIEVRNCRLKVYKEEKPLDFFENGLIISNYSLQNGETYKISKLEIKNLNYTEKVYKNLLYLALDYDKIIGKSFVRQRKEADEIEFYNRVGVRRIKKLFIDKKLTPYEKSKTLILCDEAGVFGVFGFGIASRVCVDENTKTVLTIEKIC